MTVSIQRLVPLRIASPFPVVLAINLATMVTAEAVTLGAFGTAAISARSSREVGHGVFLRAFLSKP